ncbi:MAG TPA: decaprenyl-phosphate phosphoribosyltransferase [Ilumatobacteraceae bacterium]|nr:decaprenyl-phosphate phosphoribosyltransferase [Ilumatobacteraceae bacterium]HRB04482.1 decaprenyl-phosphate phosphoribosyltransferase [Ilumatobacteraceae bacterium]
MLKHIIREARPKQWTKNVLVFAAPGAAGVLDNWSSLWKTLLAFVAFCLASSGTYYWNDINDVAADRQHPKKRFRPIASGAVPLGIARVVGTLLLLAGIGLAFALNWKLGLVVSGYIVLTTTYSTVLKHVAVVDLVAVAAGFVLRAIAGAVVTDVRMSTWFVLCTSFGSLFIVTGKRFAELRELGDGGGTRATLDEYTLTFLQTVLSVSVGATLVTYCIWAFDVRELSGSSWPFYELSIVPMLTALLRYTLILEQGHGAAPEEIFAADRTLQILGVVWLIVFGLGVYVG